jgi:hypothetical protein
MGKRRCLSLRILIVSALFILFHAGSSHATVFNAVTDFSSSNPSGPWSYGDGVTGLSFTPFGTFSGPGTCHIGGIVAGVSCWNAGNNAEPGVFINDTAATLTGGTVVFPTGVLLLHPGASVDTIVEWKALTTGTYTISGSFEILDTSPTGIIGLVDLNGASLFSGLLTGPGASGTTPGGSESFAFTKALAAGDILAFGVNNDGNFFDDSTGFNATVSSVPEPATIALFAGTLLAFGWLTRWRRSA